MRNDTTTMKLTALLPALALGGLMLTGCEPGGGTAAAPSEVGDLDTDTVGVAVDDHAGHDHALDTADVDADADGGLGAVTGLGDKADALKGDIAEKAEAMKEKAADTAADMGDKASAMGGELLGKAQTMIDDIRAKVSSGQFGDAQSMVEKLKGMPGYDSLPASIKDTVQSMSEKITAGLDGMKGMGDKAKSLMDK